MEIKNLFRCIVSDKKATAKGDGPGHRQADAPTMDTEFHAYPPSTAG